VKGQDTAASVRARLLNKAKAEKQLKEKFGGCSDMTIWRLR
jgi:hypothetical protein